VIVDGGVPCCGEKLNQLTLVEIVYGKPEGKENVSGCGAGCPI
jgi:hypothetical protein